MAMGYDRAKLPEANLKTIQCELLKKAFTLNHKPWTSPAYPKPYSTFSNYP